MWIINQDEDNAVNINNVVSIWIDNQLEYDGEFGIVAETDGMSVELGKYFTKKQAKTVFNNIFRQNAKFELFKIAPAEIKEELLDEYIKNKTILDIYEMPKEKEDKQNDM